MSKFTDFLNLFMWDSIEDSEEEFNIDKALNDNWKKIDTKVKTHVTSVNEEINNFKEETNQKIENIQALPTGGTKGQVLTKQSETEGDANWEDIEANEVFVGNEKEAPSSAKIIVEEDDFVEGSTLGKAEVYEEIYSTEEQAIGTWIDGKTLYRKVVSAKFGTVVQDTETTVENLLKDVNFVLVDKYWIDRITVANATNQGPNQDAIYQRYTSNSNNQSSIRFASKQSWASNLTVYAVIIYTKITD